MKKKNIITPDATKRELMELIEWSKAETAEWKDFLRQAQKMLKDKGKKEVKKTK